MSRDKDRSEQIGATIKERPYLDGLGGIKALALIAIYYWHSPLPNPAVDLGARGCELFFVISGFLTAYNYFYKEMPTTWQESFLQVLKKVVKFWPLHFLTFLLVLSYKPSSYFANKVYLLDAVFNLSLLQAWFSTGSIRFSYNGATWFLSALAFCWFMTPLLLKLPKKVKSGTIVFLGIFLLRFLAEYWRGTFPAYFGINYHTFPLVRLADYTLGITICPLFIYLKEKSEELSDKLIKFSALEILAVAGMLFSVIRYQKTWNRAGFILMFCGFILIMAFNNGLISKLLYVYPLRLLSKIQLEFFILHQAVLFSFTRTIRSHGYNYLIQGIASFIIVIVLAAIYKRFCAEWCTAKLRYALNQFFKSVGITIEV